MSGPLVTVIIPTHERATFLTQAVASALRQERVDVELIVVDDGSRPGLVRGVRGIDDPRVRLLRNETPLGVSTARNRGIETATGEWVAFLDDDDVWAPTKLAAEIGAAERAQTPWAYTGVVKIDERNRIIGGAPPPEPHAVARRLRTWNLVPGGCSGVIVRGELLVSTGGFDPRFVNLADWDLWIRLGAAGMPAVAVDPLVGYRFHRGQASLDVALILAEADLLDGRNGTRVDRGALHHYLAHRSLLAARRRDALEHFGLAAIRGEAGKVVSDVWDLAIARVRRSVGAGRPAGPDATWRASATAWLRALDASDPRSTAERPT